MGADDYFIIISLVRSSEHAYLHGKSELTRLISANLYSPFCVPLLDLPLWHGEAHPLRHRRQRIDGCMYQPPAYYTI